MFDFKHYVPTLKWKPAERKALEGLDIQKKKNMTPLIQLVMPKAKRSGQEIEEQLEEVTVKFREKILSIPEEIINSWGNKSVFVDLSLIYTTLKIETLNYITTTAKEKGVNLIPVVNLSSNEEFKKEACLLSKKNNTGLCLRLVCSDFSNLTRLSEEIKIFLNRNNLTEKEVDLLIDIKEIYRNNDKYFKFIRLSQRIHNLSKWRTFVFASGAFPINLNECKVDEKNLIPRLDWINWIKQIKTNELLRNPSFSDYTIQYPIYESSTQFFLPSASIKYTLKEDWLIMRGNKGKFEHYLAHAKLLLDLPEFFGENYSDGDKYIANKGNYLKEYLKNKKAGGTGNAATWLAAGINHHLTCTADQISNLF